MRKLKISIYLKKESLFIPAPIDIEYARQVVAPQEVCNSVLDSQKMNHSGDIETVSNDKYTKYNHYTQEQRDKVEEALREHGNSWSGIVIAKYANVPVSIVYTWKRELFEKGSLKYCANRNAYRKILTPNLDHKIASIISTKDNKVNKKAILEELRKEDPNVPHMSLSTFSHPFVNTISFIYSWRDHK